MFSARKYAQSRTYLYRLAIPNASDFNHSFEKDSTEFYEKNIKNKNLFVSKISPKNFIKNSAPYEYEYLTRLR
jgi:hypothetical protein